MSFLGGYIGARMGARHQNKTPSPPTPGSNAIESIAIWIVVVWALIAWLF